jgi:hypothetical protein
VSFDPTVNPIILPANLSADYAFKIIVPKYYQSTATGGYISDPTLSNFTTSIQLSPAINFSSLLYECPLNSISLCSDEFYMLQNPTPAGKVPVLQINTYFSDLESEIYLVGQGTETMLTKSIKGVIGVCGDKFSANVKNSNPIVFESPNANISFSFDLSDIFGLNTSS